MTRMEMVTETLVIFNQLKWLIALEDFINKKWYYEMCCVPTWSMLLCLFFLLKFSVKYLYILFKLPVQPNVTFFVKMMLHYYKSLSA